MGHACQCITFFFPSFPDVLNGRNSSGAAKIKISRH